VSKGCAGSRRHFNTGNAGSDQARRARWDIEMFFNVLKNGCRVESMQPGSIEGLERALALYMIVAWRIAHLMRLGRTCPESDADLFCSANEIRGAYLLTSTKPPPERKPTLNEVLRLVVRLGGFIGRKSDGEPDVKTIWLGLQIAHNPGKLRQ
jgi:hypothetical protein